MRGMNLWWLTMLVIGACTPGQKSNVESHDLGAKIDAYLAPLVDNHDLSGMILLGMGDTVRCIRAYGMADWEREVPNSANTRFRIASLTKTVTAAAIATLADRGLLSFEDRLSRFAPQFPVAEKITIRNLLRHESGLANPDADFSVRTVTLSALVDHVMNKPLLFEPGAENRYSNAGFSLLAHVVEAVSGVSYDTYITREFFEPLGMTATRSVRDIQADRLHAAGYIPAPAPAWVSRAPAGDIGLSIGSGSLSSTVEDLHRWGSAIHRNALFNLDAQIERDWPYGWGKIEVGPHRGVEQTGGTQGFMSSLAVFDNGTIIVMLLNLEHGRWTRTARDLAAIALGESYEIPARRVVVELPRQRLEVFAGRYTLEDRFIDIVAREGHLWLHSEGWPVGKYLVPVAQAQFEIPSDVGRIVFGKEGSAGFEEMTWDFGDSQSTYRRDLP